MQSLPWRSPRKLLFLCAGLDALGLVAAVGITDLHNDAPLLQSALVGLIATVYCLLSWLFGSYTVLRWPWLRLRLIVQRLLITAIATGCFLILVSWSLGINSTQFSLLNRGVLTEVLAWETLIALLIRLQLRLLNRSYPQATWRLMAHPQDQQRVIREWQRNPFARQPRLISPENFRGGFSKNIVPKSRSVALALAPGLKLNVDQKDLITQLQSRGILVTTLEELAQNQLERLPPALLPDHWLSYAELPWGHEFSFQRKLKRMADILLASVLLVTFLPLLMLLCLAIWLEDRGPVLYIQPRTGWMGSTFQLIKLRTMRVTPPGTPTPWTSQNDHRVTAVGGFLRRTRLDELPQLINVLLGQMSLIGPRPEQPSIDEKLAARIPHYAKRYWMLPGLSGWAQVCGPAYPSTPEEAELKLSYDLYYLRNWSFSLDLLILAKTIKTLLKIRGI